VYDDEAIGTAVYQSNRYISDRFLPDKAIDVLDEAGARVKLAAAAAPAQLQEIEARLQTIAEQVDAAINEKEFEKAAYYRDQEQQERERLETLRARLANEENESEPAVVSKDDIERVVSNWTGIPISSIQEEELDKLINMEAELHKRIVAQEPAVEVVSRAIRRSRAGLKDPRRPMGSFLFLGPTGVGKTEVARTLARFLFGDENALLRFDMSEYMEKHSISKLIGSPPGYVGHEEGGQLTDRVKRKPYSVVLFDEIEKAHPSIFNILLQVYEEGHLTDALGNTVDFKNCIVIMTSNVGARHIERGASLGFRTDDAEATYQEMRDRVLEEVKRTFNPEFLNRIDEIIVFHSLTDEHLVQIIRLMVDEMNANLMTKDIQVALDDSAYQWMIDQTCADRSYGARPLRRAIQKHIEDKLAEELIGGRIGSGDRVDVTVGDDDLSFQVGKAEEQKHPVVK